MTETEFYTVTVTPCLCLMAKATWTRVNAVGTTVDVLTVRKVWVVTSILGAGENVVMTDVTLNRIRLVRNTA